MKTSEKKLKKHSRMQHFKEAYRMRQKYTSEVTSVNKYKVPAIARVVADFLKDHIEKTVLDYGGGKWNTAKEFFASKGIESRIYDPYNRTEKDNVVALMKTDYEAAMLSNVLNVIAEDEVRIQVLEDVKDHLVKNGLVFIKIYEGNRSGILKVNERLKCCQLNRKTKEYLEEVREVFGQNNADLARIKSLQFIIAKK